MVKDLVLDLCRAKGGWHRIDGGYPAPPTCANPKNYGVYIYIYIYLFMYL